jgi:hypothetical protein
MASNPKIRVRCRQISPQDLDSVARLLAKGFPAGPLPYWESALQRLSRRPALEPFPRFGYLLESGGRPAGALLTIFAAVPVGGKTGIRCNISSWYVEPEFRNYASLLSAQAQKYPGVTFINISPADHTWPLLEAQGYSRFTNGLFVAATALTVFRGRAKVLAFHGERIPGACLPQFERQLLEDCHAHGCLCFWCESDGDYYPFIVRRRFVVARKIPCAQLIFCRDIGDLSRFAGAVSRYLLFHGMPFMIIGANGPIPNLLGRYFPNRRPMYYRGSDKPRIGDLSHTEAAIFGM